MISQDVESKNIKYANSLEEIKVLITARTPIIWVLTHEEDRFVFDFNNEIAKKCKRDLWLWSSYQGIVPFIDESTVQIADGAEKDTSNPMKALSHIIKMSETKDNNGMCFILRDFHTVMAEPVVRQIRDMYSYLADNDKTLIITSPVLAHGASGSKAGLPVTLEKQVVVVDYTLPNLSDIKEYLYQSLSELQAHIDSQPEQFKNKYKIIYNDQEITDFAKAVQGLTMSEIDTATTTSLTHLQEINLDKLIYEKRQLIRKSQILEFINEPVSMDDVGGLDYAKEYLNKYAQATTDEAAAYGVEPLKGILLTGIPGSGKSLLAKTIGKLWKVPLLRLDIGKVMGSLVGQSEGKMREVIQQAESMSPCILWVDEVEKGLSGTKSSNFSDGGTLSRVFGTLLTAMQDGLQGVTIIATANDITMLPPEFIRRFNEVFFVDLPGPEERWDIFDIHLKKRGRDLTNFAKYKDQLIEASIDYTGAEIEKSIKDAIAAAFHAGQKNISHKNLLQALAETKPIAQIMSNQIDKIREAAHGQYRLASSWSEQQLNANQVTNSKGKSLDIDSVMDDMGEFEKKSDEKVVKTNGRFKSLD